MRCAPAATCSRWYTAEAPSRDKPEGAATRRSAGTPPMSTSTVTGERSRGHFIGARMLGGSLASSSALNGRQSPTGLPVCVKLSLISAWSGPRWW